MKATIATLVLISMMITTAAWAEKEPAKAKTPVAKAFTARISDVRTDTLYFTVLNPDKDKVILKVYSDRDVKVLHYNLGRKDAVRLTYLMEGMRSGKYTAVVERNDEVVMTKEVNLK